MIQRPDNNVLQALAGLENDSRFGVVLEWLKTSRNRLRETSRENAMSGNTGQAAAAAGAWTALDEVLDHAHKARGYLAAGYGHGSPGNKVNTEG